MRYNYRLLFLNCSKRWIFFFIHFGFGLNVSGVGLKKLFCRIQAGIEFLVRIGCNNSTRAVLCLQSKFQNSTVFLWTACINISWDFQNSPTDGGSSKGIARIDQQVLWHTLLFLFAEKIHCYRFRQESFRR